MPSRSRSKIVINNQHPLQYSWIHSVTSRTLLSDFLLFTCCILAIALSNGCTTQSRIVSRPAAEDKLPKGVKVERRKLLATTKDLESLELRLNDFEEQSQEIYRNILDTLDSQTKMLQECEMRSEQIIELKERLDYVDDELRALKKEILGH
jgi:frataxin-like iron-binding protein CyaY